MCIDCVKCGQSFLAGAPDCPWCGRRRPRLAVVALAVCSEQGHENRDKRLPRLAGKKGDTIVIRRADAFGDRHLERGREVVASITVDGERLLYEPRIDGTSVGKGSSDARPVAPGKTIPMTARADGLLPWTIHFGEVGTLHRVARLQIVKEASA